MKTSELVLLGALGVGGYLLLSRSSAQPVPAAPPVDPLTGLVNTALGDVGDVVSAIGSVFSGESPVELAQLAADQQKAEEAYADQVAHPKPLSGGIVITDPTKLQPVGSVPGAPAAPVVRPKPVVVTSPIQRSAPVAKPPTRFAPRPPGSTVLNYSMHEV